MIVIDGSFGEGGGQIVRSSLTLAAVLGEKTRIENVRARRAKPGLMSQHLAAARALAKVCDGKLIGLAKGSRELTFDPGPVQPGRYAIEIGTAGSTTLVFQTLLYALAAAGEESVVAIHGGTHNPLAPPAEFIAECFLPATRALGLAVDFELVRHGFYPKGGGSIRARIEPWKEAKGTLDWREEIEWGEPQAEILIANLPNHVAEREQAELAKRLDQDPERIHIEVLPGELGPGNAVMVRYRSHERTALITSFGEPGKPAERVAHEAARDAKNFARSKAPVDPHLADQLLLPLVLGPGGSFLTSAVTEHARTQAEVIRKFIGVEVKMEMVRPDRWLVSVPGTGKIVACSA